MPTVTNVNQSHFFQLPSTESLKNKLTQLSAKQLIVSALGISATVYLGYLLTSANNSTNNTFVVDKNNPSDNTSLDPNTAHLLEVFSACNGLKQVGIDPLKVYSNNQTDLHHAVIANNLDFIKELLLCDSRNIDRKDQDGYTALALAALFGRENAVHELLRNGADTTTINDKGGFNSLHLAAAKGHTNIVTALIESNKELINSQTNDKLTPLHLASFHGHKNIVHELLRNGADDAIASIKGNLPIHFAAKNGHKSLVQVFCNNNITLAQSKTKDGKTILDLSKKTCDKLN